MVFEWNQRVRQKSSEAAPDVLVGVAAVARVVGRSPRTVQRWVKSGKLPVAQRGYADPNTGLRWLASKPVWLKSDLIKLGLVRQ
jgi:hypothetical protein